MIKKILYGANGFGGGHLARMSAMVPLFQQAGAEVTCLVSGRSKEKVPQITGAAEVIHYTGMQFAVKDGRVQTTQTILNAVPQWAQRMKDSAELNLNRFDLIVTDFEPVVAHAARAQKRESIGLAHQYACGKGVPGLMASYIMPVAVHQFAPASTAIGVHFADYGRTNIIPPIVKDIEERTKIPNKILVYLPFEDNRAIKKFLGGHPDYNFYVYTPQFEQGLSESNIIFNAVSREGFRRDLSNSNGIISNAGFMAVAEALSLGMKILVKPLQGQPEQHANVASLAGAGIQATAMESLSPRLLDKWLISSKRTHMHIPDVAQQTAEWLMQGDNRTSLQDFTKKLWAQTSRVNYE